MRRPRSRHFKWILQIPTVTEGYSEFPPGFLTSCEGYRWLHKLVLPAWSPSAPLWNTRAHSAGGEFTPQHDQVLAIHTHALRFSVLYRKRWTATPIFMNWLRGLLHLNCAVAGIDHVHNFISLYNYIVTFLVLFIYIKTLTVLLTAHILLPRYQCLNLPWAYLCLLKMYPSFIEKHFPLSLSTALFFSDIQIHSPWSKLCGLDGSPLRILSCFRKVKKCVSHLLCDSLWKDLEQNLRIKHSNVFAANSINVHTYG